MPFQFGSSVPVFLPFKLLSRQWATIYSSTRRLCVALLRPLPPSPLALTLTLPSHLLRWPTARAGDGQVVADRRGDVGAAAEIIPQYRTHFVTKSEV